MQDPETRLKIVGETAADGSAGTAQDAPVLEYICAMATELAHMARREGDQHLGAVLDAAAVLAQRRI